MFKGRLTQGTVSLTRGQRRLAVLARAQATPRLGTARGAAPVGNKDRQEWMPARRRSILRDEPIGGHKTSPSQRLVERGTRRRAAGASPPLQLHYDDVDGRSGDSVIQSRFNDLVHVSLLRFGPPLPPEFVAANDVLTSASGPSSVAEDPAARDARSGRTRRTSWQEDLGADGRSFLMHDEVGVETHELLHMIRQHQPGFSIKQDCDGVPFSLLIRNCPYLRAFGGRVNYMRYLRRERHGKESRVVVSIAKYKMREAASQDGVRQGPQPWKYSYKMV